VFERYTLQGRRAIFFAHYEASQFGSPEITSSLLLLGILREDKTIALRLGMGVVESIRKELAPSKGKPTPTSVDLPVSMEATRALAYAAEEAERLHHKQIHTPHLVFGLMRVEDSLPAKLRIAALRIVDTGQLSS
jgi:ATP-dependent Clp protease ATP-binding subunit ClpA